jgi:hypothetical protein
METFTGQRKLIVGNTVHLLLSYCQENVFVKSCYIRIRQVFFEKGPAAVDTDAPQP